VSLLGFIIKFVCIVGLPLFFIVGFIIPLIVARLHGQFDVEQREIKRARAARRLQGQGPQKGAPPPKGR
jgi:hypothetical protein